MIQTLGLAQSLRKTKIEPTPHAVSEVVEGNANAAGRERVRSPRRTLSIQTMAFAQDDQETGIVPFPQTVNFVQDRDDTVELGRVTSEGRYSVDGSPGFANGPQRTEVKPPLQACSQAAEDVVEPITPVGKDLMSETLGLAQDLGNAGVEFAPQAVSEPAESFEQANSMTGKLDAVVSVQETKTEPPPQAVSAVASGGDHAIDVERVTSPAVDSVIQILDGPSKPQKTQAEPTPQAISNVTERNDDGPDLERPMPPGQNSDFRQAETELPPQTISKVAERNGKTPALVSATPSSEDSTPKCAHPTETELPKQEAGKVAEDIQNLNPLERIPVEEVDVDPLGKIVFYTDPRGVAADRFRFLRMRIRELSEARKLKSLLVTSALSLDGKSTVSLNLATALAERGQSPVLLLEADLYHPTLAERLGLKAAPGLAECLSSGLAPLSVVRRIEPLSWYFLPAGRQLADPSDLLHGDGFATIMQALLPHFRWIVIDSPPVVPVADALALARQADASLLVVRAGQTPTDAVEAALESLGPKHVMGVILNGVEGLDRLYSKYNKYYGPVAAPAKRQ